MYFSFLAILGNKMNFRKKTYISLIGIAVVLLVFIAFIIYPIFLEIKKNSKSLISEKRKLEEFRVKIEELKKFKENYKINQENFEKIDELFVNSEMPIKFIEFLEKTSQDSQISLKISAGAPQKLKEDPWTSLSFQLSTSSFFPNFLKFLNKLETSPYLVEIINLDIKRLTTNENHSEGNINTNFSIKVYTK